MNSDKMLAETLNADAFTDTVQFVEMLDDRGYEESDRIIFDSFGRKAGYDLGFDRHIVRVVIEPDGDGIDVEIFVLMPRSYVCEFRLGATAGTPFAVIEQMLEAAEHYAEMG